MRLVALLVATVAVFWPTLWSYGAVWLNHPYTHGYLIAGASVWLVWRERDVFRSGPDPWPVAAWAGLGLSVLWMAAIVMSVGVVHQAAFPLVLLAWAGAVFGRSAVRRLAPIAALFFLAVPVWEVLTPPLQALTVTVSHAGVSLLGIPSEIDGNVIHIAYGSFVIEGGCAGINYLLAGLALGGLYGLTLLRRWPSRFTVMALAAALALVGNWIRVSSLIVIGHVTHMRSGLMDEHLAFGWGIFFVALLAFFPLAGRCAWWASRRWPRGPARGGTAEPGLPSAAASQDRDLRPALLASLAVASGPLLYYLIGALPVREPAPVALPAAPSPTWSTVAGSPRPYGWEPGFVGADEHLATAWTDGSAEVLVDRLVYRSQRQGAELIGYANRIAPDEMLVAGRSFSTVGADRRLVREAIVREADTPVLVWYWYRVGGVETVSDAKAKLLQGIAFVLRSPVSELIAVSTACEPESCSEAATTLTAFLGST